MKRIALILTALLFFLGWGASARPWNEILRSGKLMVLTTDGGRDGNEMGLHRVVMPIDREQALLRAFAHAHNLKIEYVTAPSFASLFSMLEAGKGDLISANVAETPARRNKMLLSEPFDYTREIVFTSVSSPVSGASVSCLVGHVGMVLPGTTYAENLRSFASHNPGVVIKDLSATISHDDLIENVCSGRIAYSVLNECDLDVWRAYRSGIRKLFPIKNHVPLVFAARNDSSSLIRQLNIYIRQLRNEEGTVDLEDVPEAPAQTVMTTPKASSPSPASAEKKSVEKKIAGTPAVKKKPAVSGERPNQSKRYPVLSKNTASDLPAIRRRGYIRMLTSNDVFSCYLHRGELCGFEYELAKRFADSLNVTVITVIPVDFKDLPRYLAEGKGDFIAANFTKTPERIRSFQNLTFCASYCGVTEVLVGRTDEKIRNLSDLAGRKIYVRKGNSYYDTLKKLQKKGVKFQIELVPEKEITSEILRKVASGQYDLTVADNTFLQANNSSSGGRLKRLLDLSEERPFSWVVRKNNPQLAKAVNDFFKKENRGVFFNLCKKRYYSSQQVQKYEKITRLGKENTISPYDPLFRKYGSLYHFDWYFLAAQSYQESRFNPDVVNHIGAAGLMQVMPKTAEEMKVRNLKNPDNGVHAGAKYMSILRDRFSKEITRENKLCFALASYNAGYGHLQDARILAKKLGLNPNIWFNHTEKALALLENPVYAAMTKYGYCRASETIAYVRNIMAQSYHYEKLLEVKKQQKKK